MDVKTSKLLCLDGYSKQFSDECCLAWRLSFLHPSHLSFPDHVHDLISLEGSPCRFKRKEAQPRFDQPFDEAVVLFNEVVHVFDLSEFDRRGKDSAGFEVCHGFGRGRVLLHVDDAGS